MHTWIMWSFPFKHIQTFSIILKLKVKTLLLKHIKTCLHIQKNKLPVVGLACVCLRTTARVQLLICWPAEPTFLAQLHGKHLGDTSCTGTCIFLDLFRSFMRTSDGIKIQTVPWELNVKSRPLVIGKTSCKGAWTSVVKSKSPLTVTHADISCAAVLRHKELYQHRKKPNGKGAPK